VRVELRFQRIVTVETTQSITTKFKTQTAF